MTDDGAGRDRPEQRRRRGPEDGRRFGESYSTPPPPRPAVARATVALQRGLGRLPLRAVHALAALLGGLTAALPTRERRVTDVNLRIAFPELTPAQRARLRRRSLIETAKTFGESGAVWSWDRRRILATVREVRGETLLREALAAGRGAILAAPHLGNWELVGIYCSTRYPMTSLYQRPRVLELEPMFRASRERFGARLVPAGLGAVRSLSRALEAGEVIGILPDQDAGSGLGVFVPFFGKPANTMTLLSRLAARTGARVVLGWAERLPRGRGFRLHFSHASAEVHAADVERSAAALNRDVEALVREHPEQYLWSYKRFRIRPRGERDPYRADSRE